MNNRWIVLFLFEFFLTTSLVSAKEDTFRILMLWRPQAQFAGFYVAQQEGLYKKAGVTVEILHPTTTEDIFDSLRTGKADLVMGWLGAALERRIHGDKLVHVVQFHQSTSLVLVARKDAGIKSVNDLSGHRIGLWFAHSNQVLFLAFLIHHQVKNTTDIPISANMDLFLHRGVDVTCAVTYNELVQIYMAGINPEELTLFSLAETFPFLVDDGLYCMEKTYRQSPEVIARIRQATFEGWRRAFNNKKRTLDLIRDLCRKEGDPFNLAIQRRMLNSMEKLIDINNNEGFLKRFSFEETKILMGIEPDKIRFQDFAPGQERP